MKMKGKSRFYTAINFFKLLPGTEFHNLKLNAGVKAYFCLFPCFKWFGKTLLSMVKAVQQIVKGSMSLIIEKSKACEDLSHAVESFSVSKSMWHSSRAQCLTLCHQWYWRRVNTSQDFLPSLFQNPLHSDMNRDITIKLMGNGR